MFGRLWRRRQQVPRRAVAPPGVRIYAVGDVHGRLDLLLQLHEMIAGDASTADGLRKVVVYLGDYVDRGQESRQVIQFLLDEALAGFESVHLRGNHEEIMLAFLDDVGVGPMWMSNGGDSTLLSYGVGLQEGASIEERHARVQEKFRGAVPEAHLRFLRDLRLYHVEGDYLFVHAGIAPGKPLEEQNARDLLWIRDEFIRSDADHGKCVVHGHTIAPAPDLRDNRIGIDTGAYFSGTLTCLVLEGETRRFLQT
jgi:serine/threonine protein phosphatase 1